MKCHLVIDGVASCNSPLSIGYSPPISCLHGSQDEAEASAQRIRAEHPDAEVVVVEGSCPTGTESYDAAREDRYTDPVRAEWDRFLSGRWTMAAPTEPGLYMVAGRDGVQAHAPIRVELSANGLTMYIGQSVSHIAKDVWTGYFWSCPLPNLWPVPPLKE